MNAPLPALALALSVGGLIGGCAGGDDDFSTNRPGDGDFDDDSEELNDDDGVGGDVISVGEGYPGLTSGAPVHFEAEMLLTDLVGDPLFETTTWRPLSIRSDRYGGVALDRGECSIGEAVGDEQAWRIEGGDDPTLAVTLDSLAAGSYLDRRSSADEELNPTCSPRGDMTYSFLTRWYQVIEPYTAIDGSEAQELGSITFAHLTIDGSNDQAVWGSFDANLCDTDGEYIFQCVRIRNGLFSAARGPNTNPGCSIDADCTGDALCLSGLCRVLPEAGYDPGDDVGGDGDGDGDSSGNGDGDGPAPGDGDGDGDGDGPAPGDGDGDGPAPGDGDGDAPAPGDGDPEPDPDDEGNDPEPDSGP